MTWSREQFRSYIAHAPGAKRTRYRLGVINEVVWAMKENAPKILEKSKDGNDYRTAMVASITGAFIPQGVQIVADAFDVPEASVKSCCPPQVKLAYTIFSFYHRSGMDGGLSKWLQEGTHKSSSKLNDADFRTIDQALKYFREVLPN